MVSVFTSPKTRVEATLTFMGSKCPAGLVKAVKELVPNDATKKSAGKYIKLGLGKDSDKRRALRSLLLCQCVFVEARSDGKMSDWGKTVFGSAEATKTFWKNKSDAEITKGVEAYDTSGDRCLADMLEGLGKTPGDTDFKFNQMTRDTKNLGAKEAICYQTIALGLWLGGYASIAWLATWYASLNAGNCFDVLGAGTEVQGLRRRASSDSPHRRHEVVVTAQETRPPQSRKIFSISGRVYCDRRARIRRLRQTAHYLIVARQPAERDVLHYRSRRADERPRDVSLDA